MSFFVPKGPTIPSSGNFRDLFVQDLKAINGGGGGKMMVSLHKKMQ
jgi:hypothetical protein